MNKGSKHYNNNAEKQLNIKKDFKIAFIKNCYSKIIPKICA